MCLLWCDLSINFSFVSIRHQRGAWRVHTPSTIHWSAQNIFVQIQFLITAVVSTTILVFFLGHHPTQASIYNFRLPILWCICDSMNKRICPQYHSTLSNYCTFPFARPLAHCRLLISYYCIPNLHCPLPIGQLCLFVYLRRTYEWSRQRPHHARRCINKRIK